MLNKRIQQNQRLAIILILVICFLLTPFIAMQFSDEVAWSVADFLLGGLLLLGVGLALEFILRKVKSRRSRIILLALLFFSFVLVWAELAVGVLGTPFAGS
jgi:hypothetical protein